MPGSEKVKRINVNKTKIKENKYTRDAPLLFKTKLYHLNLQGSKTKNTPLENKTCRM